MLLVVLVSTVAGAVFLFAHDMAPSVMKFDGKVSSEGVLPEFGSLVGDADFAVPPSTQPAVPPSLGTRWACSGACSGGVAMRPGLLSLLRWSLVGLECGFAFLSALRGSCVGDLDVSVHELFTLASAIASFTLFFYSVLGAVDLVCAVVGCCPRPRFSQKVLIISHF